MKSLVAIVLLLILSSTGQAQVSSYYIGRDGTKTFAGGSTEEPTKVPNKGNVNCVLVPYLAALDINGKVVVDMRAANLITHRSKVESWKDCYEKAINLAASEDEEIPARLNTNRGNSYDADGHLYYKWTASRLFPVPEYLFGAVNAYTAQNVSGPTLLRQVFDEYGHAF